MKKSSPLLRATLSLLFLILFLFAIIQARNFLYPIVFGVLFAYLLYPLANWLEKHRFPRILAGISAIFVALIIISITFFLFYNQLTHVFEHFEHLRSQANKNIELLQQQIHTRFGLTDNSIEEFLKKRVNQFFDSQNGGFSRLFSATTGTVFRLLILPVYIFLFLFYRTKFAYFILKIVKKKSKPVTVKILRDISTVAARYMGGVSIVVLILCVLNSLGLVIIGLKYAILLGIISAFFNFIPYFGTLMGGSIPLLFALLTAAEPSHYAIRVIILFIIIQFIENNILTPNIVGNNVKINPFFVITGLVMGSMVWGIPGMLVIVPFLAVLRIIFSNIESLIPFAFLLGPRGTKKHSITLNKIRSFFIIRKKPDDR